MILCAEDADGNLSLMVPEKKCLQVQKSADLCITENKANGSENV